MKTIERRLRRAEKLVPQFDYASLSDADLRAALIEEMIAAQPNHAAALRRAGERIATGTAWPVITPCESLQAEYEAILAELLIVGHE